MGGHKRKNHILCNLRNFCAHFSQNSYLYRRNLRDFICGLDPLNWSNRTVKVFFTAIFAIILPIYLYFGLQPSNQVDATGLPSLKISSISLDTPVESVGLVDHTINVPDKIAGAYSKSQNKTLLVGHSSTVFENLKNVKMEENFEYAGENYQVKSIQTLAKSEIDMHKILAETPIKTVILMTCAGESLPNRDATHRLIVVAERI